MHLQNGFVAGCGLWRGYLGGDFTSLSHMEGLSPMAEIALGRTNNLAVRYAAAIALLFNVLMVVVAMIAIMRTIPKGNSQASGTPAA
ncbi:hypothetical protein [Burkholderia sp. S171]|uniref:hypothetical protein n=1 Tax=Burkholderia sp. S171 TaxID=1641860 RepID=UPI00131AACD3|nr:hypothetical protein [Burkholderia sp. S171]